MKTKRLAALAIIAMALVGMAGAVQLSTGPADGTARIDSYYSGPQNLLEGGALAALDRFNETNRLDQEAIAIPVVTDSGAYLNEVNMFNDTGVMETPAAANYNATVGDQPIYDPRRKPVSLGQSDTARGNGVRPLLVQNRVTM